MIATQPRVQVAGQPEPFARILSRTTTLTLIASQPFGLSLDSFPVG
jgi:hypothetical protein